MGKRWQRKKMRERTCDMRNYTCTCIGAGRDLKKTEEAALAAITSAAAEIAGISKRVGTLTPGKDADIVVTAGHPFDWNGRVKAVFIDGKQVR